MFKFKSYFHFILVQFHSSYFQLTVQFVLLVRLRLISDVLFAHDIILSELIIQVNFLARVYCWMVVKSILISFIQTQRYIVSESYPEKS